MEVQALKRSASSADPLRQNIGRLIGLVGTQGFEQSLFEASRAATRCSHLTAFVSASKTPPRPVVAANAGPLPTARALADRYVKQYWNLDPANSFARSGGVPEQGATLRLRSGDINSPQYRNDCYTGVELEDRFSLLQPVGGKLYRINFYCRSHARGFGDDAIRSITESADFLMALLARHETASAIPQAAGSDSIAEQLRFLYPAMPAREIQICVGIARGLTSEGIAIEYGIALNTVLTYRKRAYARLGISSQNELLRCVLSHPRDDSHCHSPAPAVSSRINEKVFETRFTERDNLTH